MCLALLPAPCAQNLHAVALQYCRRDCLLQVPAFLCPPQGGENSPHLAYTALVLTSQRRGGRASRQNIARFARHAETLFAQRAGIRAAPWEQALEQFLALVEPHDVDWWLAGSAALAVRGLPVTPGDVNLCVDGADARRLGELLLEYLVEPVMPVTGWVCDWWGRAFMGACVEWIGGAHERADTPHVSDFGPIAARRRETVYWRGHALRVPPLEMQLAVNERRGRTERAAIIRAALQGYNDAEIYGCAYAGRGVRLVRPGAI